MRFVDRFVQDEGSKALDGPLLQTESEWVDIGGPWKMYRHQSAYFTLYKGLILRLGHVLSVRCRKQASVWQRARSVGASDPSGEDRSK